MTVKESEAILVFSESNKNDVENKDLVDKEFLETNKILFFL